MKKVLITGGTGFIGSHLVELLLRKGHSVSCLVRDPANLRWLAGLDVEIRIGDCLLPETLISAVKDVSVVIHAAGLTKARRVKEYYEVNHVGTRNLLEACSSPGGTIERFVLISSLAAAGPSTLDRPAKETDRSHPVSDYGKSKLLAESEALRYRDRFPVTILRPSAVYGPRDTDVFELFRWASKGFLLDVGRGERHMNWCHVQDLAQALFAAGTAHVPSGSIYFIAEDRVYSSMEFREMLLRAGGLSARSISVPAWAGYMIGTCSELAGRISGKATIMNRQKVREAVERAWTCDPGKARQELGFRAQIPLKQGLASTWAWYRENGWLS